MDSLGIDIVEVERIKKMVERWGKRFLNRVFTDREIALCRSKASFFQSLAARLAAKEALLKALGAGEGVPWRDMEVLSDTSGKPQVNLLGKAKEILGERQVLVSLSHTEESAIAVVILTGKGSC